MAAVEGTEKGIDTTTDAPAANGDAAESVAAHVTVDPDAGRAAALQVNGGCDKVSDPSVRNCVNWSVTVSVPLEMAAVPLFVSVRVSTPPVPAGTEPPAVPPVGVWVAVRVIVAGAGMTIESGAEVALDVPPPVWVTVMPAELTIVCGASLAGTENGMTMTFGVPFGAIALAAVNVAVQVTVCPPPVPVDAALQLHGPCVAAAAPTVRVAGMMSVTVSCPVNAVVPPLPVRMLMVPVPPARIGSPVAPPVAMWLTVIANCAAVNSVIESVAEDVSLPGETLPLKNARVTFTLFVIVVPVALALAVTGIVTMPALGAVPAVLVAVPHVTCPPDIAQLQPVPPGVPVIVRLGSKAVVNLRASP